LFVIILTLSSRFNPASAGAGIWVLNWGLNSYGTSVEKVCLSLEVFVINYSSRKHMIENTSPCILISKKLIFSEKKLKSVVSWNKTTYNYNQMYSTYISWHGFLPTLLLKPDSEIYLCVVNSKTQISTQASFIPDTLEFGSCLFSFHCTHMTPQACSWPILHVLGFTMCHLDFLWFLSSSGDGLIMRLPCNHFHHLLNQKQIKFFMVYLATAGWENGISFQYTLVKEVKTFLCQLPQSLTNWIAISHSLPFVEVSHELIVVFNHDRFLSSSMFNTKVSFCRWSMHI